APPSSTSYHTALVVLCCSTPPGPSIIFSFFFFNDPAPTDIYTLSLHDALPISQTRRRRFASLSSYGSSNDRFAFAGSSECEAVVDRKSTRLNSSHSQISYAVFCLKKKNYTRNS